jgi:hypothetical protein
LSATSALSEFLLIHFSSFNSNNFACTYLEPPSNFGSIIAATALFDGETHYFIYTHNLNILIISLLHDIGVRGLNSVLLSERHLIWPALVLLLCRKLLNMLGCCRRYIVGWGRVVWEVPENHSLLLTQRVGTRMLGNLN